MSDMTPHTLIERAYLDPGLRMLTQRMRAFLRGRNAGELVGFDRAGKPISCRLIGTTRHGTPVSTPGPREAEAAYLFYGAAAQDTVAEGVATKQLWETLAGPGSTIHAA